MRGRTSSLRVTRTDAERYELEKWTRKLTMPTSLSRRTRIILLYANGKSVAETARLVGVGRSMVRHWVARFVAHRVAGLSDKKGRGRQPAFSPGGRRTPCEARL